MRFIILIFFSILASAGEKVDVYLLSGQSNMQGIGKLKNLKPQQKKFQGTVKYWSGKAFVDMIPGKTRTSSRAGDFGPELGMARKLAGKKKIYFIKFHRSGQPLHHGWNGNRWAGGKATPGRANFYPGKNAEDPAAGKHYKSMSRLYNAALAKLKADGIDYDIKGFVWMQGEQDSKNSVSATEYAQSLKHLKKRVEEDFCGDKRIPMAFGQVLPHTPALERFTHRTEIRRQMALADAASGSKEAIPGCRMVPTEEMPLLKDKVHYNAEGQLKLGEALAEKLMTK